jgi:uncharacterized protein (DUF111 family)
MLTEELVIWLPGVKRNILICVENQIQRRKCTLMEVHMDDMQMQITKEMMEEMWDIEFLSEADEKKSTSSAAVIATYTDPKGRNWVARSGNKDLNPAQIDAARQIMTWMATRS